MSLVSYGIGNPMPWRTVDLLEQDLPYLLSRQVWGPSVDLRPCFLDHVCDQITVISLVGGQHQLMEHIASIFRAQKTVIWTTASQKLLRTVMLHPTLETDIQRWYVRTCTNNDTCLKLIYLDTNLDCLCGLVVRVPDYRSIGPGFGSWHYQIFWEVMGLEWGPLSPASTIEELLERKSGGYGLETVNTAVGTHCADHATPSISKSWQ
jgi:hypothetical protein